MTNWKIISRSNCAWCDRAKAKLALEGIEFEEHFLTDPAEIEAFKAQGFRTVPIIYHGDVLVGGFDRLAEYLANLPA